MSHIIFNRNDDWETPIQYWEIIEPFIPNNLTINDPFFMNGNARNWWKILNRDIIHENKDFFSIKKSTNAEIYVSSPPYSIFNKVLKHLFYLDKAFVMLIPINKLGQIKLQRIIKPYHIQIIISPIYTGFIDRNGEKTKCPSQYFCFMCWKLNLEKDFIII